MRTSIVAALLLPLPALAQDPAPEQDVSKVDADYALQGEYSGKVGESKLGVQVVALGDGNFRAVGYKGGLPGDGFAGDNKEEIDGKRAEDGSVAFEGEEYDGLLRDGVFQVRKGDRALGQLAKVERESPTLGAEPPAGAVVLFDGRNLDHWRKGTKMTDDGLLIQGANTTYTFQSCKLHLEFRTPYKPKARGQGRGNSGCYLQARYEVQVLDSFGLQGKMNECGGIYSIKDCDLNMCYPPLRWQTYDIDFTAAAFDADGKKTADARMTVRHNGVVIHDDVALPKHTTAAPLKVGPAPGYLHLQNHGNPVRYRNIWLVPVD